MFHMLSCFDLINGVSIDEFQKSNSIFLKHMRDLELVQSTSPIGRRNKHPIMDTDKERDQEYFYIMSFVDEDQCNLAVKYIQSNDELGDSIHISLSSKIENYSFICWEDI